MSETSRFTCLTSAFHLQLVSFNLSDFFQNMPRNFTCLLPLWNKCVIITSLFLTRRNSFHFLFCSTCSLILSKTTCPQTITYVHIDLTYRFKYIKLEKNRKYKYVSIFIVLFSFFYFKKFCKYFLCMFHIHTSSICLNNI